MSKNIIVVGGGAAGMLAAYFAADAGNKVTLLENKTVRKLTAEFWIYLLNSLKLPLSKLSD